MVLRETLENYLGTLMRTDEFNDYCPNGLQVEGQPEIKKLIVSTSVSQNLIEFASKEKAQAILVHHGLFWKNSPQTLRGAQLSKIKLLIESGINLFSYHLPLDFLPEYGNNYPVLKSLGAAKLQGLAQTGYTGILKKQMECSEFFGRLDTYYGVNGIHIPRKGSIKKVGIVSGNGTSFFREAIEEKVDAFISGEGTEWVYQLCHDHNVAYSAMGHYQSECIGPKLLGDHLAKKFHITVLSFREANPF